MSEAKSQNFPEHWQEKTLGEILKVVRGVSFPSEDKKQSPEENHIACLRTANVQENVDWDDLWYIPEEHISREEQYVRKNDILISTANSYELVGKVSLVCDLPERTTLGAFISLIRVPEGLDSKFFFYQLRSTEVRNEMRQRASTTTNISNISTSDLNEVPLGVPPLPEQRRIVAKIEELFSNLDAGMADLQAAGQQLERYRLSVLQAAVEGRLTADWRHTHDPEPADQLLERILEKRRERWEEDYRTKRYDSKGKTPPDGWKDRYSEPDPVDSSDLPSLPSSWKWVRFEQISLLDSGYAFSSDKFTDEGMPLLRGANVAPGHLKWGDTEYWPEDEVGSYEHLIVEEGDIILAMDRPLINAGLKIARAEESDTPCLLVQRVARFKPVFESLTAFLYLTCSTQRFIAHLREGQTGTQIPHVSKKSLRAYPVPLPPLDEQKQIVDEVERLLSVADDAAATADRENTRAERLRQSILKQAFSGRLVPHDEDAAPQVGGSVSESADSDSSEGADGDVEDLFGSIDPSKQIEMDL